MRLLQRLLGGLDGLTLALLGGGALLLAASLVGAAVLLAPPGSPTPEASPTPETRPSEIVLPADRVATVLHVDVAAGAGGAARSGDHVDVLGFFPHSLTGSDSQTRLMWEDVPVLSVDRNGATVALTLAVPQAAALVMQEAQALGVRPFVALRPSLQTAAGKMPATFSDTDLAQRLGSAPSGAAPPRER